MAADEVDATYFASAGELAETLEPRILAALLKKKLKGVEAKMAEERGRPQAAPKDEPNTPEPS